jgi:NodT family efflux transporter outer membrane factor (OMF) lipoprotein
MSHPRLASTLLCAAILAGCSEAPVYTKPAIAVPAAYKGDTAIWQPAQPADQMPRGDWWKSYDDAVLDGLILRLDAANADLAVAMGHFDQATAYAAQARSDLFPTLSAGAYTTRNQQSLHRALRSANQPSVYGDNSIGLLSSYEVDLWGRVRNLVESGEAGAQAAAADLESVRLSLRAELANDYFALRILDEQNMLLASQEAAYAKALQLTRNRYEGGIDSALDVSRAKVQLDNAKARHSEIRASRALYEHAIATLVGEPASGFAIAPAVSNLQLPQIPVGVPTTLLERRPDIAAAERRLAAANADVGVAKAAFFPRINLAAAAGYESTLQPGLLSAPNLFWSIGPNALLTIFDAGRRQAVVAQAEGSFKVAGAQYRATVLRAFQEVEDNLSLLKNLTEESQAVKDAVQDSGRTLNIAMNRYREGTASYLEVVTAQTAAQRAQLEELDLRRKRLQASVNLIRALGGGWNPASPAVASR